MKEELTLNNFLKDYLNYLSKKNEKRFWKWKLKYRKYIKKNETNSSKKYGWNVFRRLYFTNEKRTFRKEVEKIILGKKLRCPMTEKEVDEGIQYGLQLRDKMKKIN